MSGHATTGPTSDISELLEGKTLAMMSLLDTERTSPATLSVVQTEEFHNPLAHYQRTRIYNTAQGDQTNNTYNTYHINSTSQGRAVLPNSSVESISMANAPSTLFTGRSDYIQKLANFFTSPNATRSRRIALLHGLGGTGKTQICLKFLEADPDLFQYIFWIDASSTETIRASFIDVADSVGLHFSGNERSPAAVQKWLANLATSWILVFDNTDNIDYNTVSSFFPRGTRGNILITSRNPNLRRIANGDACWEVNELAEPEALALLVKAAGLTSAERNETCLADIVKELCCFPLAIDQAGALILSGACTVHDFLEVYRSHRSELMRSDEFKGASQYGQAVYTTWDISYAEVLRRATDENKKGARVGLLLLLLFPSFHHTNIQEETFLRAALCSCQTPALLQELLTLKDKSWDPLAFRQGIAELQSFSLISSQPGARAYSMHPLVHAWCADKSNAQETRISLQATRWLIATSISSGDSVFAQYFFYWRQLVPHIQHIHDATNLNHDEDSYTDDQCLQFGRAWLENGNASKAEYYFSMALKIRQNIFGLEDQNNLTIMSYLGQSLYLLGRHHEGEALEIKILEIAKRLHGDEDPNTFVSMTNLASTLSALGRHREAAIFHSQTLKTQKRVLGEEHPSTLTNMSNFASTLSALGRHRDAEALYSRTLEIRRRTLGDEHPSTLISMSNLASTLSSLGRYPEAETLRSQTLNIRKRVYGDEHPNTLISMSHLASTLSTLGKHHEAETLHARTLEIQKRLLGEKHLATLTSMTNLASTLLALGRHHEAEVLLSQTLEIQKRVLGEEHPTTLTSMSNIASTLSASGRYQEAETLHAQILEIEKRVLGEEHPDTLISMSLLGSTLLALGRYHEAETLLAKTVEIEKRVLGEEHPDTLITMSHLTSTLSALGRHREA